MRYHLKRLVQYRELIWMLALSELKGRHRQTMLGMIWALLQPVSLMLIFTVVFSIFVKVPIQGMPYALFAYTGLISWLFVANSLSIGLPSIVGSMNLVTKASFPREVVPLSKLLTAGFDFLVGGVILSVFLFMYGVPVSPALIVVPGILAIHVIFTAGLVLWGSAVYVLKRDLGSLLPLALQLWMFMSPVAYPVTLIPSEYKSLYLLNPMASIMESYRSALLLGRVPSLELVMPVLLISCTVLITGYAYFKSVELKFADRM